MKASPVVVDNAVKAAQSLPDLVTKFERIDPALAEQLQSKALVKSKSVWGPLTVTAVALISTKYGLGWSEGFCELFSGVVLLLASAAFRALTRSPIGGLFRKGTP